MCPPPRTHPCLHATALAAVLKDACHHTLAVLPQDLPCGGLPGLGPAAHAACGVQRRWADLNRPPGRPVKGPGGVQCMQPVSRATPPKHTRHPMLCHRHACAGRCVDQQPPRQLLPGPHAHQHWRRVHGAGPGLAPGGWLWAGPAGPGCVRHALREGVCRRLTARPPLLCVCRARRHYGGRAGSS